MKYWTLKVNRSFGIEEIFDLRARPVVHVGDDTSNEVCLETISVPSQLPIVRHSRKGPILRLTKEVESSLKGKFQKKKDWKTRLYQGSVFQVEGPCSWNIEGVSFTLELAETIPLTSLQTDQDPKVRKHLFQSLGYSAGTHLTIILLIFAFSFAMTKFRQPAEEIEVQKVSILQVQELFKKPEPMPEPEPVVVEVPEPEQEVAKKEDNQKPQTPRKQKAPATNTGAQPAAAAPGKGTKTEVTGMGLLAIQTSNTQADRSLKLDKPKVSAQVAEAEVGASFSSTGIGIRSGNQTKSVAMLGGISGSSYQSGDLGSKVQATDGKGIQLVRKEVEIRGGLDRAIIQQIIEERLSEVRYCYENALFAKTSLSGKISTSWTIQADGSVANLVSTSDDLKEKVLHDCIKERIVTWRFPQPKGGGVVHVNYPFVFSSLGG